MARMIPPFYDNDAVKSRGEKDLFNAFRLFSDDYCILHSLGIAMHYEKIFGEIDFVVISKYGVLCLEVKSGFPKYKNGIWVYPNGDNTPEGPFKQVSSAMHSLRGYLVNETAKNDPTRNCLFAYGVMFPDMPFDTTSTEWSLETVFDVNTGFNNLENYIVRTYKYWRNQLEEKHGIKPLFLSCSQIERVTTMFRSNFGFIPSLSYILKKTDEQFVAMTKTQYRRLSMAKSNPRTLLTGGAGTGKTLLCLEYAKTHAAAGRKVLLLCYNSNLGSLLELDIRNEHSEEIRNNIKAGSFHRLIMRLSGVDCNQIPERERATFFSKVLPEKFLEFCSENEVDKYDVLVVDEGQDLFRLEYMSCMEQLLKEGFEKGIWICSYDQNQNLYNREMDDGISYLEYLNPIRLELDVNCRNSRPIISHNTVLTAIRPSPYYFMEGEEFNMVEYNDREHQLKLIKEKMRRLIGQGVNPGNICILSKYKLQNSGLMSEDTLTSVCQIQDITDLPPEYWSIKSVKFSTIHSFKGLESQIVFFIDVDSFVSEQSRIANYIAISRASALLYLFYDSKCKEEMDSVINEGMEYLPEIRPWVE